jgi:hypothetical protein
MLALEMLAGLAMRLQPRKQRISRRLSLWLIVRSSRMHHFAGYDSQFIQNWKTTPSTGCSAITMTTADNTTINAYFRIK